VYPKLSSIGSMMRIPGSDQVVWVMTDVKALTVCWGMPEMEADVDIVNEQVGGVSWRPCSGYARGGSCGQTSLQSAVSLVVCNFPIIVQPFYPEQNNEPIILFAASAQ
jgi:hypothetical protein